MARIRGDRAVWVSSAIALAASLLGFAALHAPVALAAGESVVDVAAGNEHTCVLLDDGKVRCNPAQIGGAAKPGMFGPVDLGSRPVAEITAGEDFTCALADDGSVRCWGPTQSSAGAIGLGEGRSAEAVAAGASHACAVLDNGKVRCWGSGANGQLGRGNTDAVTDPGSVPPVDLGFGRTAVDIAAGRQHTCAILDNGDTLCWGSNAEGQLGYPSLSPEFGDAIGDDEMPADAGPVDYGGGVEATAVSAGTAQTCALLDDQTVRCWGSGANGRLGYGGTGPVTDPASAGAIGLGGPATAVDTHDRHTCARLADGSLSCWGLNQNGQLGYANTLTDATMPSPGGAIDFGPGRTVAFFTVGGQHNCAVLDDGALKCWGFGEGGRLGYGTGNFDNVGDDEDPADVAPIDATDRLPSAVGDSFAVDEDSGATPLAVLANDTDVDLGPKQILSASDPAGGTVAITGGGSGLTYTPDPDFCGPDSFTYTITGGSSASVAMTVNCVAEPGPASEPSQQPETEADTTAPETTFTSTPKATTRSKKKRAKLTFRFAADEAVSGYECSVDGKKYAECDSPLTLKVKRGTHYLDVRAHDLAGNVDPTPARHAFQVVKKRSKRGSGRAS